MSDERNCDGCDCGASITDVTFVSGPVQPACCNLPEFTRIDFTPDGPVVYATCRGDPPARLEIGFDGAPQEWFAWDAARQAYVPEVPKATGKEAGQ